MKCKGLIKNKIKKLGLKYPTVYKISYNLVSLVIDFDSRQHKLIGGDENKDKTFYVIRPRTNSIEGLMALLVWTLEKTKYAEEKGYIPVVDMKNYQTQYGDGKTNVWNWFFDEKSQITLDEVYRSKRVILSGYRFKNIKNEFTISKEIFYDDRLRQKVNTLFSKYYSVNSMVYRVVNRERENIPIERCIGVFLRGTDYVKLRPSGEPIQPTAEMVIKKVKEFKVKHPNAPLFLVTEDQEIYDKFQKMFPDLYIVSYDKFIGNYQGKDFLSKENVLSSNKKELGMHYLAKIILLTQCKYFVGSIAGGSKAAYILKNGKYDDEFVFDLGNY